MHQLRTLAPGLLVVILGCSVDSTSLRPHGSEGDVDGGSPSSPGGPADDDGGTSTTDGGVDNDGAVDDDGGVAKDGGVVKDGGTGPTCVGLAYCDGFETYSGTIADGAKLGPWIASVSATGATMTIDSTKAYAGKNSLHIVAGQGTGPATHGTLKQAAPGGLVTGNNLFGRAMVYYANGAADGLPTIHSWFFTAGGTTAGGAVGTNMGSRAMNMALNFSPSDKTTPPAGGNLTAGAWHCLQWQFDGSGAAAANVAKVWVDGKLAINATPTDGFHAATPWTSMAFGFMHYQTITKVADVYLDEFAVSGAKIPCN